LNASGDKLQENFQGDPQQVGLTGIGDAKGGGVKSKGVIENKIGSAIVKAASSPLMWCGIALFIGGVVLFLIPLRRAAMVLGAGGVVMIAASFIPAWAWLALMLIGFAAVGIYVWSEFGGKRKTAVLEKMVRGVEDLDDDVAKQVKERIGAFMPEDNLRTLVRKVKTRVS
jgi:hypothetical protein